MQGGGVEMAKTDANPVNPVQRLQRRAQMPLLHGEDGLGIAAARLRRCEGGVCAASHGAGGGQPAGKAHPGYKHGLRSREFVAMRKLVSQLGRDAKRRVASLALATVSLLI